MRITSALVAIFTFCSIASAQRQMTISQIDLIPDAVANYQMRDWRDTALKFDNRVFDRVPIAV